MMETELSASELALKLIEYISSGQFENAQSLFADDAEIKVMLSFPGPKVLKAKDLRMRLEQARIPEVPMYHDIEVDNVVITPAADPEVATVEWAYKSRVGKSGEIVENYNVIVLRARNGKIIGSHDYHNHAMRDIANGQSDHLVQVIQEIASTIKFK